MSEEFWLSEEGILIRLEDLSGDFTHKVYNGAVQGSFKEAGFELLVWTAVIDEKTCDYCDSQAGREYKPWYFLPKIPAHNKCRCFWDVLMEVS